MLNFSTEAVLKFNFHFTKSIKTHYEETLDSPDKVMHQGMFIKWIIFNEKMKLYLISHAAI